MEEKDNNLSLFDFDTFTSGESAWTAGQESYKLENQGDVVIYISLILQTSKMKCSELPVSIYVWDV